MRLYDALTFLQDCGMGDAPVSIYQINSLGFMTTVDEALSEQTYLSEQLMPWYDLPVVYEPRYDSAGRLVLCLGAQNGTKEPEWDGFWTQAEFSELNQY